MKKELNELLKEVDVLFKTNKDTPDAYSFTLARVQRGFWSFNVVDNWHKWLEKGYETDFTGNTPQDAIEHFLTYVCVKQINVKSLCYKYKRIIKK